MSREDALRDFADEHLWYEIKAIADLTARLARHAELFESGLSASDDDLAREVLEPAGRNADIEAWAMHMGNVFNFLYGRRRHSDVVAYEYFDEHHEWTDLRLERPDSLRRLNDRLPVEIDHLSLRRTTIKDKTWPYDQMWGDLSTVIRLFIDNVPKGRVSAEFVTAVRSCLPPEAARPTIEDLAKLRPAATSAESGYASTATTYMGGTATMGFEVTPNDAPEPSE